jgi:hypothetical protein
MGGACAAVSKIISGGGSSSTTSKEKKNSEANKQAAGTKLASQDYTSPKGAVEKMKDDLLMDLGVKEKDVDYYARLDERQERSKALVEKMRDDKGDRKPAKTEAVVQTTPKPVAETPVVEEIKPPEPPKPVAEAEPLTPVTEVDTTTEGDKAPTQPDVGAGTTTALGGEEEAAKLEKVAEGEAEKKVAETVRKGRRSTITTTPQGLLAPAPTRRRRTLMGGLLS